MSTDTAIVIVNCLYNCPVMPERKLTGTNTAHSTSEVAMMALPRPPMAFFVASYGERCSSFIMRSTFSTTTMASSHHNTDGKDQSQQRHHVERETECQHHAECSDQRYGHRYDGDKRGAPVLQRQEDHENHQQQRLEERMVDLLDRLRYV